MYKKLLIASLFLVSCEKEVIEPVKYYRQLTKNQKVVEANKKPRTKKRKRRYEKINKNANVLSIRFSKHSSSCYIGSADSSIRSIGQSTH